MGVKWDQARGEHQSRCGRFGVKAVQTPDGRTSWQAIDRTRPAVNNFDTLRAALRWCERRAIGDTQGVRG